MTLRLVEAGIAALPLHDDAKTLAEGDASIAVLHDQLPMVMHLWNEEARQLPITTPVSLFIYTQTSQYNSTVHLWYRARHRLGKRYDRLTRQCL